MIRIEQDEIKSIIATHYNTTADSVCLYHDYKFVRKGDDKKRIDFVCGIVDLRNSTKRGWITDELPTDEFKFCPNCGADMRGDEKFCPIKEVVELSDNNIPLDKVIEAIETHKELMSTSKCSEKTMSIYNLAHDQLVEYLPIWWRCARREL